MSTTEIIHSNRPNVDRQLEKAIEKSLRLVGGQVERFAKETISDMDAVDTGFLRNSITFALAGEDANISEYQDDDGNQTGTYEGTAEMDTGSNKSVYIGSNVYYAPYVEYGTTKMKARPFLQSAIQNHTEDLGKLFEEAFQHFMK